MAAKDRSIAYIEFQLRIKNKNCSIGVLRNVIEAIQNQDVSHRKVDFDKSEKVVILENSEKKDNNIYWITLKTGKYGYTANLIDRHTGEERNNDKTIDEGEKELTHMCLKILENNAICALESNRDGAGARLICNYFEHFIKKINSDYRLSFSWISTKGIADILEKANRIMAVDVECSYLDIAEDIFRNMYGNEVKETFAVQFRPERRKSLAKDKVMKLYSELDPNGKIRRLRIKMRTDEGDDVLLDSMLDKVRDKVSVETDSKGVILSRRIFSELQHHLEKIEEMI